MPQQVLSTSDGTTPSDYFEVIDSDDLIMAVSFGTSATGVRAEISFGTHDIHVTNSTLTNDGIHSLDLVPDGSSVRLVPEGGGIDAFLDGSFVT